MPYKEPQVIKIINEVLDDVSLLRRYRDIRYKYFRIVFKGMTKEEAERVLSYSYVKDDGWQLFETRGEYCYAGLNRKYGIKKYMSKEIP